jgi:ribulose-5-phosphate 4-epimerase/fuculose-1-phosphate aldolase
MTEEQIRQQLVAFARRAYQRRLVGGTGGNLSARLPGGRMLITASGLSLEDTAEDNLLTVDIETGDWQPIAGLVPSREHKFHMDILRLRPEVSAVLHVHPPHATAYAVMKRGIPMLTDAAFKQPPIPSVSFAPSGSEELRQNVAAAVRLNPDCRCLLLEQHGIIALGEDITAAYNQADLIEELATIAYYATRPE